jgi:hypothetical protein
MWGVLYKAMGSNSCSLFFVSNYVNEVIMSNKTNYPVNWKHSKHENVFINGKQKNKLPPLEILNWLFRFDEETGKLYRIRESSGKVYEPEREITYVNGSGYMQASVTDSSGLDKMFLVHQIIYFMDTGVEPLQIVDHVDGDTRNNRFSNLRLTTESGNNRNQKMRSNNTSGYVGVTWDKQKSKWMAQIRIDGKNKNLGYYDTPEEAYAVRLEAIGRFNLHNIGEAYSYRHTNTPSNGTTPEDVNQE